MSKNLWINDVGRPLLSASATLMVKERGGDHGTVLATGADEAIVPFSHRTQKLIDGVV
jgi:hypothetical protein